MPLDTVTVHNTYNQINCIIIGVLIYYGMTMHTSNYTIITLIIFMV